MIKVVCFGFDGNEYLISILEYFDIEFVCESQEDLTKDININEYSVFLFFHIPRRAKDFLALRELKSKYPSVPIIVISDKYSDDLPDLVVNARAWSWMLLPEDGGSLKKIIQDIHRMTMSLRKERVPREVFFPPLRIPLSALEDKRERFSNTRIRSSIDLIHARYMESISINELADSCCMSEGHFSREFKKMYSITVQEYIKQYRIGVAERLLLETSKSIFQIALESGYKNISNFNNQFKSVTGKTPTEFRKCHVHQSGKSKRSIGVG